MIIPLNDGRFITRSDFCNEQALLAAAIHNDAVHTQRSTADSTENQNDSRSTSNNSSQAQEFNIPDVLVTIRVAILRAQSKVSLSHSVTDPYL